MINRLLLALGSTLSATAMACSSGVGDSGASSEADISEAESHASAVLWTQGEIKVTQYLDAAGHAISQRRGVEIAVGTSILRLKSSQSTATLACAFAHADVAHEMNGMYFGYSLSLASSAGLAEQVMLPLFPMPADDEYSQLHQEGDVVGSVGPFVFVREARSETACGAAHGSRIVRAFVWNAARGAVADLGRFAPEAVTAKAQAALDARGPGQLSLVEVLPRFDAAGRLTLAYRFEKPVCYACGDGLGDDSTVSTTILGSSVDAELPSELSAFAEPPPAVASWLAANPGVGLNGWSVLDGAR